MSIYPRHAGKTSPISDRSGYHANEARRKVPPWPALLTAQEEKKSQGPSYCMCTVENELLQQRLFFLVFFLYPFKINLFNTFLQHSIALPPSQPRWWRLVLQSLHKHAGRASSRGACRPRSIRLPSPSVNAVGLNECSFSCRCGGFMFLTIFRTVHSYLTVRYSIHFLSLFLNG